MRYLNLRKAARRECAARMRAILDGAVEKTEDGENARQLTEEERAEMDQLRGMIEEHDRVIRELMEDDERMGDHEEDRSLEGEDDSPGSTRSKPDGKSAPNTRAATREQVAANQRGDIWKGRLNHRAAAVQVRSEPLTYGDPRTGLSQFLVDLAIRQGVYEGTLPENNGASVNERMNRHVKETAVNERDTLTGNLPGIVIPMFDPAYISRGIEEYGVTLALLDNRPLPAKGDSLTLPRVTGVPVAEVQQEGQDFNDTNVRTSAVKADLYTIGEKAPISVQAVERGYMAVELLQDEMIRAWTQKANRIVLYGDGATNEQPLGLLRSNAADDRAGQFVTFTDAAPTAVKYLDQLTRMKGVIFSADKRRPDAHIVNEETMTWFEQAKAGDQYLIPPFANWAYNAGGAGTLPEVEGPASEMTWRRVPTYVDTGITATNATDRKANAGAGGTQSYSLSMVRGEMPIFHEGPRSFQFDQTLAASGEHLIVCRGYAMFNPMWRPEAWRVLAGTGTIVPGGVLAEDAEAFEAMQEAEEEAQAAAKGK